MQVMFLTGAVVLACTGQSVLICLDLQIFTVASVA